MIVGFDLLMFFTQIIIESEHTEYLYKYFLNNMDLIQNGYNGNTFKYMSIDYLKNLPIYL